MKPITTPILIACGVGKVVAPNYTDLLNELLPLYSINTLLRVSHLMAQLIHESAGFRAVEEYASGAAYEGRIDLGNTHPGDGVRYKGRGLIQLTGRSNYTAFGKKFGIDCVNHPELLELPRWALASALDYWNTRKLNLISDQDDIVTITRRINGGLNGIDSRRAFLAKCRIALAPLF